MRKLMLQHENHSKHIFPFLNMLMLSGSTAPSTNPSSWEIHNEAACIVMGAT